MSIADPMADWAGPISGITLVGCLGALAAVDLISWRRTAALRRGVSSSGAVEVEGLLEMSPATLLPGWAGLACFVLAVAALVSGSPPLGRGAAVALAGGGAFVAVTGFRSRVAAIQIDAEGMTVRFAHRRATALRWEDCSSLGPPRTPLAAWRVSPGVSLMPSDLLGHEGILSTVVARAGLAFDGRGWTARGRVSPRR